MMIKLIKDFYNKSVANLRFSLDKRGITAVIFGISDELCRDFMSKLPIDDGTILNIDKVIVKMNRRGIFLFVTANVLLNSRYCNKRHYDFSTEFPYNGFSYSVFKKNFDAAVIKNLCDTKAEDVKDHKIGWS